MYEGTGDLLLKTNPPETLQAALLTPNRVSMDCNDLNPGKMNVRKRDGVTIAMPWQPLEHNYPEKKGVQEFSSTQSDEQSKHILKEDINIYYISQRWQLM